MLDIPKKFFTYQINLMLVIWLLYSFFISLIHINEKLNFKFSNFLDKSKKTDDVDESMPKKIEKKTVPTSFMYIKYKKINNL